MHLTTVHKELVHNQPGPPKTERQRDIDKQDIQQTQRGNTHTHTIHIQNIVVLFRINARSLLRGKGVQLKKNVSNIT